MKTYLLWEFKADETIVRLIADSEEQALERLRKMLPFREYRLVALLEYWLPGVTFEGMITALQMVSQKEQESKKDG